jgi:hypothetical protein
MEKYNKPLPDINGDSKDFWAGCKEHELRFQKCKTCGHVRWPASIICPICYSREAQWIVARGKGRVYTFVVYHVAYHPGFENDLPYVVRCEMPVEVTWEDITDEFSLPKFRPSSQPTTP